MGTSVPYITVDELKRSPVINQLRKLTPRESEADRDAELAAIIKRASAMINGEVNQNLAATTDYEVGKVAVDDWGNIRIHTRANPIINVISVSVGNNPGNMTPITNLDNIILDPWRITIPQEWGGSWYWSGNLPSVSRRPGRQMWAQWTYTNGYPATTLASEATAGDTSITVANATGIIPNVTELSIEDGKYLEILTPTAVDEDTKTLTVPPLAFSHLSGVGCTALPDDVKECAMLLCSRLHDTWSLTMGAVSVDGSGAHNMTARPKIMCDAATILAPYRRWW
jgi:hypothetical protein